MMTNRSSWHMTRSAKRFIAGLLSVGMLGSLALSYAQASADPTVPVDPSVLPQKTINTVDMLTPKPNVVQPTPGVSYTLPQKACVSLSEESLKPAVDLLNDRLTPSYGVELSTADAQESCPIHISKVASIDGVPQGTQSNEAYKLDVDAQGVRLEATSVRGALWGSQTLLQLVGPWVFSMVRLAESPKVPGVHIVDAPRYAHRGFMLDPARSFYPVDEVKRIIDVMSYMKMNVFHLHISDDQGFRVEITNDGRDPSDTIDYTQLAKASETTAFAAGGSDYNPDRGRAGYYTQQEFIDLVTYAARHGIGLIPEIDGPGHSTGILHAIPQLNTEHTYPQLRPGETVAQPPVEKHYTAGALDTTLKATYTFMKHVMTQLNQDIQKGVDAAGVAEVAMPYFHLGGDELAYPTNIPECAGKNKNDCKRIRQTKQQEALQRYLGKTGQMVTQSGRTAIVWNDGLAAANQLPQRSVIQMWVGTAKSATDYVKNHHGKIILSPVKQTYLVQRPSTDVTAPTWACRNAACTNQIYYNWNPTAMAAVPESSVLGVENAVWSEHLRTLHDTEFMMYPRMFATAEVAWTLQAKRDYTDFSSRVGTLGLALINGLHTFHLASSDEIPSWFGQYKATYAENLKAGQTVQIGAIAKPGLTSTDGIELKVVFTDSTSKKSTTLPVTLSLAQAFHYQDKNKSSGRFMNSPVEVKTVIPEKLAGQSGELVVTGVVPDSSRGAIALVPAFAVNSSSPMSIQAKEESPAPAPDPKQPTPGEPANPEPGTPQPDQPSTPSQPSNPGTPPAPGEGGKQAPVPVPALVSTPGSGQDDKKPVKDPVKSADKAKKANSLAKTGTSVLPVVTIFVILTIAGISLVIIRNKQCAN